MFRKLFISTTVSIFLVGLMSGASAVSSAGDPIGSGKNKCVPGPAANCSDVAHKWKFKHNGDLRGANFSQAKLHGADMRGARLDKANFRGALLRHADLHDASLVGADFSKAIRPKKLGKLCTENCESAGADLSGADLHGANLSGANLSGADLFGADLTRANLTRANLTRARLERADLFSANLESADLSGANLSGADFAKTYGMPIVSNETKGQICLSQKC